MVVLAVEDAGPGIPPEDIPRVFEPFYRSTRTRRRGLAGVGLGLAVVERIAVAFGGSVRVRSEAGSGCRFEVRLVATEPHIGSADAFEGDTVLTDERQSRGN
jgi:signal transduction histidine kinase